MTIIPVIALLLCIAVIRVGVAWGQPPTTAFTDPACETPCVLGIQPGRTSQQQVENLLTAANVPYHEEWIFGFNPAGVSVQGAGETGAFIGYAGTSHDRHAAIISVISWGGVLGRCGV